MGSIFVSCEAANEYDDAPPQGGRSDGLYNKQVRSELSDNPNLSGSHLKAISYYINKYFTDKGRRPTYTHLNKQFGIRATAKF
jgi:hypothetical protein